MMMMMMFAGVAPEQEDAETEARRRRARHRTVSPNQSSALQAGSRQPTSPSSPTPGTSASADNMEMQQPGDHASHEVTHTENQEQSTSLSAPGPAVVQWAYSESLGSHNPSSGEGHPYAKFVGVESQWG